MEAILISGQKKPLSKTEGLSINIAALNIENLPAGRQVES